jgi:hypothetical protein
MIASALSPSQRIPEPSNGGFSFPLLDSPKLSFGGLGPLRISRPRLGEEARDDVEHVGIGIVQGVTWAAPRFLVHLK